MYNWFVVSRSATTIFPSPRKITSVMVKITILSVMWQSVCIVWRKRKDSEDRTQVGYMNSSMYYHQWGHPGRGKLLSTSQFTNFNVTFCVSSDFRFEKPMVSLINSLITDDINWRYLTDVINYYFPNLLWNAKQQINCTCPNTKRR